MKAFFRFLDGVATALGALFVAGFTLIMLADVVCRYWLKLPLAWAAEATVFLFQVTCLVGSTVALRRGMHFGLGQLMHDLFPSFSRVLRPVVTLIVVGTSLLIVWLAIRMAIQSWNAMYVTLPMTQATVYVFMAVSAGLLALFGLESLLTGAEPANEGVGE